MSLFFIYSFSFFSFSCFALTYLINKLNTINPRSAAFLFPRGEENQNSTVPHKLICNLGFSFRKFIDLNSLNSFYLEALELGLEENRVNYSIGKSLIFFLVLLVSFIFKIHLLCLLFVVFLIISVLRLVFEMKNSRESLKFSLNHILECLKILCIKNHQPLKTAFREIASKLSPEFISSKKLLLKFSSDFEEYGMNKAIENFKWTEDICSDFKNLLIAINLSGSKSELLKFAEKISIKFTEAEILKKNNLLENVQIYLLAPVMLMLLLSSYPLFLAIKFSLKGLFLS